MNPGQTFPLSLWKKWTLVVLSFVITALGQPSTSPILSLLSASLGLALFWRALLTIPQPKKRFLFGFLWYGLVGCVQFSWFLSHPYGYIYGVLLFCAFLMALPSGALAFFIKPSMITSTSSILALSALWTILEWLRLFVLSGLPFNPIGLSLTAYVSSMQLASIGGIYLLSFWVIATNFFVLRAYILPSANYVFASAFFIFFPFLFGFIHLYYHNTFSEKFSDAKLPVLLLQSSFPIEENIPFRSAEEMRLFVQDEWNTLLEIVSPHQKNEIDLIVFPEYVVPFGTHYPVFPLNEIKSLFIKNFDSPHFAEDTDVGEYWVYSEKSGREERMWLVSNAFIAQTLANTMNAHVVIGLEDASVSHENTKRKSYSSAHQFIPYSTEPPKRYDKQILVPMGEYIPFEWAEQMAKRYGISGSFTPGKEAVLFSGKVPYSTCICYEELYGNLMRKNRLQGAHLLVNLTNDGWYPGSQLPKQHFDHAKLRTVENGIPLIRACNTGVTAAIDSRGNLIALLDEHPSQAEALFVELPTYHYSTLYSRMGDTPVILFSLLCLFYPLRRKQ